MNSRWIKSRWIKSIMVLLFAFISVTLTRGQSLFESALTGADSSVDASASYIHGFVRSTAYAGMTDKDKPYMQSLYGQLALIADVPAGKYGNAYAEVRFRAGNEFSSDLKEAELREAYINLYFGSLHIRTGKQIIAQGITSFINPTDIYSPADPIYRSPYSDDLRMGTWALMTTLMINKESSFAITWYPIYRPSKLITDVIDFPFNIQFSEFERTQLTIKNSSIYANYDFRSSYFDLALSFYHGYRNTPGIGTDAIVLDPVSMMPESLQLRRESYLINSPGLNISVPAGNFIIRGEGSWLSSVNKKDDLFSEISYAAEIEQTGSGVTLIGGYYGKYILDFDPSGNDPILITGELPDISDIVPEGTSPDMQMIQAYFSSQVEYFNRIYNYQAAEFYHAVYTSLTVKTLYEMLDITLPVMYNFTSDEFTFMPSVEYKINDQLTVKSGAYILKGKEGSFYKLAGPALNALYLLFQLNF